MLQSNRFVDSNTSPKTISILAGTPSIQPFSPFTPTADYSPTVNGGSGYFDGSGDYLTVPDNVDLQFGTDEFTIEFWGYWDSLNDQYGVIRKGTSGAGTWTLFQYPIGQLTWGIPFVSNDLTTTGSFKAKTWNHIAVTRDSGNTLRIFINGVVAGSLSSYTKSLGTAAADIGIGISHQASASNGFIGYMSDLRIVKGAAVYTSAFTPPTAPLTNVVPSGTTELLLNFTNAGIVDATGSNNLETVGNAQVSTSVTKWGSSVAFDGTGDYLFVRPTPDNQLGSGDFTVEGWFYANSPVPQYGYKMYSQTGSGTNFFVITAGEAGGANTNVVSVIIDNTVISSTATFTTGTWNHFAVVRSSGSVKVYLNGSGGSATTKTTNIFNLTYNIGIGSNTTNSSEQFNGYIEDLRITKGYARYTGNFTVPDAPFAYGTSDINYKQWTPNNFYVGPGSTPAEKAGIDSLVDTPTPYGTDTGAGGEVRGNYCTLNPLAAGGTVSNGNLKGSSSTNTVMYSTLGLTGQKFYWEVTLDGSNTQQVGIADFSKTNTTNSAPGDAGRNGYIYLTTGFVYNNGTAILSGLSSSTTNDVIGVAYDATENKLWVRKNNGSWFGGGDAASGTTPTATTTTGITYCPVLGAGGGTDAVNASCNFGQRPFAYTAPSGFKALVTTNLPEPTVVQGDDYFNTVLYTGNGSTQSITGVGFQPDLVWIKKRTTGTANTATNVFDAVRGAGKPLFTSSTSAELTGRLTAFGSDGFTVDSDNAVNDNSQPLVAWNWKANGAGSSNTDGTIPSTVSANTTAGISIVTYTGTGSLGTVGHGLGVKPSFILTKSRSTTEGWGGYHKSLGASYGIFLELTDAAYAASNYWNNTEPTSTVFTVNVNRTNNGTMVAYCFAEVEGFSKFGSYTGNGSADGPFVYTGFRPAFVVIKRTDSTSSWASFDSARSPYNVAQVYLRLNDSAAEETAISNIVDLTSNGFKLRLTSVGFNASGGTYIYMAFAENPFKNSLAR
jgi:hypothetical protein